ncbi:MAG: hypothetical protein ACLQVL_14600 [Terriglobia bacterium]
MTQNPYDTIWRFFTPAERHILLKATVEDMLEPSDALAPAVPVALRARFMALVIKGMPSIPLPDESNLATDPKEP